MFGMSFMEVGIVLVLALLLLGPDELPKVAKMIGKGMRDLRKASDDLKSTFDQEMVKLDVDLDAPRAPVLMPPPTLLGSATAPAALPASPASVAALDQLRDPAVASARMLAITHDPAAARAAARLAAAHRAETPAPAPSLSAWQDLASGSQASMAAVMANLEAGVKPAPAAVTPASEATVDAAATPAAPGPSAPAAVAAAPVASAASPAPAVQAAAESGPVARPAEGTIPREKKSGPA